MTNNGIYFYPENYNSNRKTKLTHPYSYDSILIWRNPKKLKSTGSVWTDRLFRWNSGKYESICLEIFGNMSQYWNERSPENVEKFLKMYLDKPNLILVSIEEHCNQSSGYPTWFFSYTE